MKCKQSKSRKEMERKNKTNTEMKSSLQVVQRSTNTAGNVVKDMDDRTEKGKQGIIMNSKNQYITERSKDLNKWKNIPCSGTERLNIIKMVILPKQMFRFNTTPVRIPAEFFVQIDKLILKFIWNCKGPRIVKIILKMNKEGCTLSEFKTCSKVLVTEAVRYWHTDRHTEQWNRNTSPQINLFVYGQLIFGKKTKIIH